MSSRFKNQRPIPSRDAVAVPPFLNGGSLNADVVCQRRNRRPMVNDVFEVHTPILVDKLSSCQTQFV